MLARFVKKPKMVVVVKCQACGDGGNGSAEPQERQPPLLRVLELPQMHRDDVGEGIRALAQNGTILPAIGRRGLENSGIYDLSL